MGKIYYMMGKSSSGKDTLFKMLKKVFPDFKEIVLYTTRPLREGEVDGKEYHFVADQVLEDFQKAGKMIELRSYDTIHGIWKYATVDDGQVDLQEADYLSIGTLESYEKLQGYYGKERMVPLYIEVEDGERLFRALSRERMQEAPKYAEMCRRFLADTEDFSEDKLLRLGIQKKFINDDRDRCLNELIREIRNGNF